ncbi:hypothetical protein OC25_17055 [Pedobacter kyungheensis]|uniref:Uncharacterized protein n=1 Tax=Pedobacter kyungheensis TaxID=1069985 RepID=A0A0C1FWX1_9SPHI|nr:hypothetical protein OC25_17055 [Pedobacter kyungheensis]
MINSQSIKIPACAGATVPVWEICVQFLRFAIGVRKDDLSKKVNLSFPFEGKPLMVVTLNLFQGLSNHEMLKQVR